MREAAQAVQRQASWSSLAHDMTAEYRSLCAEEVNIPVHHIIMSIL